MNSYYIFSLILVFCVVAGFAIAAYPGRIRGPYRRFSWNETPAPQTTSPKHCKNKDCRACNSQEHNNVREIAAGLAEFAHDFSGGLVVLIDNEWRDDFELYVAQGEHNDSRDKTMKRVRCLGRLTCVNKS